MSIVQSQKGTKRSASIAPKYVDGSNQLAPVAAAYRQSNGIASNVAVKFSLVIVLVVNCKITKENLITAAASTTTTIAAAPRMILTHLFKTILFSQH